MHTTVNIYFVASPLQYLAARAIAEHVEVGGRQILVWYKAGVGPVVVEQDWDATWYMPWPRIEPMPGAFGKIHRLLTNLETVRDLVGSCKVLNMHSAVFDTEAINYFLRYLPKTSGAAQVHARILPDGLISIRRYPLSAGKRILQCLKKVRYLLDRRLNYWCFKGDRIGSDAVFCDRIYVVSGLPHEYPAERTVVLPPLVSDNQAIRSCKGIKKALVIGQPLVGTGLVSVSDLNDITQEIKRWLKKEQFDQVDYKGHPKDPHQELLCDNYSVIQPSEPLEVWMSKNHYDAVVGVRSSSLVFARQIYPADTKVLAFGWNRVKFKSKAEFDDMQRVFTQCGIQSC